MSRLASFPSTGRSAAAGRSAMAMVSSLPRRARRCAAGPIGASFCPPPGEPPPPAPGSARTRGSRPDSSAAGMVRLSRKKKGDLRCGRGFARAMSEGWPAKAGQRHGAAILVLTLALIGGSAESGFAASWWEKMFGKARRAGPATPRQAIAPAQRSAASRLQAPPAAAARPFR